MDGWDGWMMARVLYVDTKPYRRVIAVSDVHGNGHLLKQLLEKVCFCDDDALMLLGDYIEKSGNSLETVCAIMQLEARGNVYALAGNCDTLWEDVKANLYRRDISSYMRWREKSLLNDMCDELQLAHAVRNDPEQVMAILEKAYGEIFEWLRSLAHIIDTPSATFVHAGLDPNVAIEAQEFERCVKRDAFMEERIHFDKPVVVGHMPVQNYCALTEDKLTFVPLIDLKRNMICIDGGNGVKRTGQLNALILEDGAYRNEYVEELPLAGVIAAQAESKHPMSISWNHNEVEVLFAGRTRSLCRHLYSNRTISIPNGSLHMERNHMVSDDYTDYQLGLRPGDVVSVADDSGGARVLVKKDGVMGWAHRAILTLI